MEIPAVFAVYGDGKVKLSEGRFEGTKPVLEGPLMPLSALRGRITTEVRSPIIAADANSLG
jgi:hypothetical protein